MPTVLPRLYYCAPMATTPTGNATATIHIVGMELIGPLAGDTIVLLRRHPRRDRPVPPLITTLRRLEGDRVNAYLHAIVTDEGETVVKSAGIYEAIVAEEGNQRSS